MTIMNRALDYTDTQKGIAEFIAKLAVKYDRQYWQRQIDSGATFPREMWDEIAANGYLGIIIPEKYGGVELSNDDLRVFLEELSRHGLCTLHFISFFMDCPFIVNYGSYELKERMLPQMAQGAYCSFAITEPDAGTNTVRIRTRAVRDGDDYLINGQKLFITGGKESEHMVLIARTTPYDEVYKRRDGISIFVVDSHAPGIEMHVQDIATFAVEKQYTVFFEDVRVPKENLIGQENQGFDYLFSGLNLERILIAAFTLGMGEYVLERGVKYAGERRIFDEPIGNYQGIQHMLSRAFVELKLAGLANQRAARAMDAGEDARLVGMYANIAKLACSEAGFNACDVAIQVHGGYGMSREYDVINFLPMLRALRMAPVNNEMVLNYLGEHVLGLGKSYR
jgi:acyl-CoA dehydrogenase